MSGSVCSPPDYTTSCDDCPEDECLQPGFGQAECCSNWVTQLNFTKTFISIMDSFVGAERFSIVAFSTDIKKTFPLESKAQAFANLANLTYHGGWTNTGDAIKGCYDSMKGPSSLNKTRVIVILTDGAATAGHTESGIDGSFESNEAHQRFAVGQAENVKDANIVLIPVAVKTGSLSLAKLTALATDPSLVIEVTDFQDLATSDAVFRLAANAKCGYNSTEAENVLDGVWVNVHREEFEVTSTFWHIVDNRPNNNRTTARVQESSLYCPYNSQSGKWCIAMHGDSLFNNINTDDSMLLSNEINVADASKIRVQFDYKTRHWNSTDHFHLDFKSIKNGVTDLLWTEHTYEIAVNFNNEITGTMEKWLDVPVDADKIIIRFHIDASDGADYKLFIDNIDVKKLVV
jgi:hypothetical protein